MKPNDLVLALGVILVVLASLFSSDKARHQAGETFFHACAVLTTLSPFYTLRGSTRVDRAKMDVKNLEQAACSYESRYGDWPATLFVMTLLTPAGSPALLPAGAIIDPWGREYNYDPMTLHPKTGRPLIWTEGPEPGVTSTKIANWDVE